MSTSIHSDQRLRDSFNVLLGKNRVDTLVDGVPIDIDFAGVYVTISICGNELVEFAARGRWTDLTWLFAQEVRVVRYPDGHRPIPGPSSRAYPTNKFKGLRAEVRVADEWGESYLQVGDIAD